jgi:hypothetical protein
MPETTSNIEFAHRIHERGHGGDGSHPHRQEWLEILEAVALAAVAVLTAWSGYQAARWDAKSAAAYALAADMTVQAQEQQTLAGQEHIYDITTFDSWIEAKLRGEHALAAEFERRFRPDFAVTFAAWLKTDPFHDPKAPPGPSFMSEYRNARLEQARAISREAHGHYKSGVADRETGDEYVRITVVLATVLLLTALSQRFKILGARVGLIGVAFVMLVIAMYWIATFPKA